MCQQSKGAAKFKLVTTLMANLHMECTIMYTFILAFGLDKNMILDRPMIARCDLAVDAVDMSIIFRLVSGEQTPDDYPDGVEGMLQVKYFTRLNPIIAIDPGRRKIWEQARLKNHIIHRSGPVGKYPTGLVDFHMEGTEQVVTIPLNIHEEAMMCSRMMGNGAYVEDPTTGKEIHVPFVLRAAVA